VSAANYISSSFSIFRNFIPFIFEKPRIYINFESSDALSDLFLGPARHSGIPPNDLH